MIANHYEIRLWLVMLNISCRCFVQKLYCTYESNILQQLLHWNVDGWNMISVLTT